MGMMARTSMTLMMFPHHRNLQDRAWHRLIRAGMCMWLLYLSAVFCLWMYGVYYISAEHPRTEVSLANHRIGAVAWQHVSAPHALGGGTVAFLKSVRLELLGESISLTIDQSRDPRTLFEVQGWPRTAVVLFLTGVTMVLLWIPALSYRLLLASVARVFYGTTLRGMLEQL